MAGKVLHDESICIYGKKLCVAANTRALTMLHRNSVRFPGNEKSLFAVTVGSCPTYANNVFTVLPPGGTCKIIPTLGFCCFYFAFSNDN